MLYRVINLYGGMDLMGKKVYWVFVCSLNRTDKTEIEVMKNEKFYR